MNKHLILNNLASIVQSRFHYKPYIRILTMLREQGGKASKEWLYRSNLTCKELNDILYDLEEANVIKVTKEHTGELTPKGHAQTRLFYELK
jgi:predicted transcriptional regulator